MTRKLKILTVIVLCSGYLQAQERNEEVTIIAPYQPSITEGVKLTTTPVIEHPEKRAFSFDYGITDRQIQTEITPEPLDAQRYRSNSKNDLLRNYIRAGFGTYVTPYLEFHAGSKQSDEHSFAFSFRHRSSNGGIRDYAPNGYSRTGVNISGEKYFGKHSTGAKVYYDHDVYHFYGYQPDSFPEINLTKKDIRQRYQTVGGEIHLQSNYTKDGKLNHAFTLSGYHLDDIYENLENSVGFEARLNMKKEFFSSDSPQEIGLLVDTRYLSNSDSIQSRNNGVIRAVPYFDMIFDQYRFKISADVNYELDSAKELHIYPILEGEVTLVEDHLAIFAGIKGRTRINSLRSLATSNPYLGSPLDYRNTTEKFTIHGGVRGSVSQLNFYLGLETTAFEDMPLFVNDTSSVLQNKFLMVYDDGQLFRVRGTLSFERIRNLRIAANIGYTAYSMDREEQAWHRPSLEASLEARLTLRERLTLKAEVFSAMGRYALARASEGGSALELDNVVDLNLGAEYLILSRLSAFIELRNLANSDYQLFYRYPVQGFQAMIGVGYSF